ncbi:ArsA-related P-loop ATPase [Streptomyces sp. RerS4]|uniref:ArsA family ATPase n=1 Tax=Streptomyces sp. RerS4 TaxID=2942449 RepID=UPI00201C7FBC|nr:ArsA-related P-loop ATPase [Streptomyces sp. RerS4]UQX00794.1 ArsA family ATPase [Streptomyces sp. RerS4]
MPHTLLVTGPGGAGRTTVAAATALAAAHAGRRVLLLSADDLPDLAPTPGLRTTRVDSGTEFREELAALQERGSALIGMLGGQPLGAEELTELPGAEQFSLLRALHRAAGSPDTDLVVVDMPPLHQALTTLALPAQLRRYLARLLPAERQAARALRPVLAQLAGVPMPAQWLYETAARWDEELAAVQAVVEADTTRVRLVVEPGPAADKALRAGRLGLALHRLDVEALVGNRLAPTGSSDPWTAGIAAQQDASLARWTPAFPVARLPHLGHDLQGPDDADALAKADGLVPGPAATRSRWAVEDRLAEDGVLVWVIPLPGARKSELDLVRRGDELLLTVGPYRRTVSLPSALRRCAVSGAALAADELRIRFTPDPGLWPRTA